MKSTSQFKREKKYCLLVAIAVLLFFMGGGFGVAGGWLWAQDTKSTNKPYEEFKPENFSKSTIIDNEWMPLKPGMRWVYAGTTLEEGKPVPHRLVVIVTDLVKLINGIHTVVSYDLDYSAGELVEAELAFYAQDDDGNIWRMGEYPEEYEDGEFVAAPTWIAGIADAKAGISMRAKPRPGTPDYSQGWAPAVEFTDRGRVDQMGLQVCVPLDCYENVLVIAETSASEPDAQQLKYFARGIGNIRVGWRGEGEKKQEVLELVDFMMLGPETLAQVRARALKLEKHAYEVSKNVYGRTPPSQPAHELASKGILK
ncbi:MAG: hypothetical protein D6814_10540 [Calditrichaeota bacterium]|nr:MAG: hypothetical protein D6814_10540 [Calditrichota bacterium]